MNATLAVTVLGGLPFVLALMNGHGLQHREVGLRSGHCCAEGARVICRVC
jgi:hypothetical protein